MLYLLAGPIVALIGIAAVFFVLRRKSVDKRSMYSARRSQIEHKVRAARQRTLAPRGHADKPAAEPAAEQPSPFATTGVQPTINYPVPAYQAPPTPPPTAPPAEPQWQPPAEPQWQPPAEAAPAAEPQWQQPGAPEPAWETGPSEAPPPPPPGIQYPEAPPPVEPFQPAPERTPRAEPSEPAWTPAPAPSEPGVPLETPVAASATSAGSWSVVTTTKDSSVSPEKSRKGQADAGSSWQLASGEAPGGEDQEPEGKRPSGTAVAVAQYAVLVVGLVMVLIGVLVMVADSHVT